MGNISSQFQVEDNSWSICMPATGYDGRNESLGLFYPSFESIVVRYGDEFVHKSDYTMDICAILCTDRNLEDSNCGEWGRTHIGHMWPFDHHLVVRWFCMAKQVLVAIISCRYPFFSVIFHHNLIDNPIFSDSKSDVFEALQAMHVVLRMHWIIKMDAYIHMVRLSGLSDFIVFGTERRLDRIANPSIRSVLVEGSTIIEFDVFQWQMILRPK